MMRQSPLQDMVSKYCGCYVEIGAGRDKSTWIPQDKTEKVFKKIEEFNMDAYYANRHFYEQIRVLEEQQTPRRLREAVLGIDGGWLENLEKQIKEIRDRLTPL